MMKTVGYGCNEQNEGDDRNAQSAQVTRYGCVGGYCCAAIVLLLRFERIFGDQAVFVKAQIVRRGADKSAVEGAPRQDFPVTVFQSLQKTGADPRGGSDLFERDAAHFPFAF